ncbi:monocyte to macrophage differentiation factor-like isoform X2 [Ornithodoros turicata]|uniref:monocyte to macrophage differentiation factor-like isoform X2 n=1 Tax=Ornithodoros turicata TaxID=34597 RepID=UPI003138F83D
MRRTVAVTRPSLQNSSLQADPCRVDGSCANCLTSSSAVESDNGLLGCHGRHSLARKLYTFWMRDLKRLMNHRPRGNEPYVPTEVEHLANVTTHALSILPSFFGLKFLVQRAHTPTHYTAALIYGAALVLLFVVSSLFHSIHFLGKLKALREILHRCDRAAIYIFIASAYTPWLLLKEYSSWGQKQLYVVWLLCLLGIAYQNIFHEKYKTLEVLIYMASALVPASATFSMRPATGLKEIIYGGCLYFVGVLFFKLDGRLPFAHAIWHLFVNAATMVHYQAVYRYLFNAVSHEH